MSPSVALVVGGTGEIGAAIARRLVDAGATVEIAGDRPAEPALDSGVRMHLMDVRDDAAVETLVREVAARNGRLDTFVYCAGIAVEEPPFQATVETFDRTFAINMRGAFISTTAAARVMIGQRDGAIVLVASTDGLAPAPGYLSYSVSKAALVAFAKGLSKELGGSGVRVNALCPGHVDTDLARTSGSAEYQRAVIDATPLGRAAEVSEVAAAVEFLSSSAASFVTGAVLVVDGGRLEGW